MSTLACALVLAASREDPRVYDQPLDVFRGCCEGLSILLLTLAVVCEVYNVFLWVGQTFNLVFVLDLVWIGYTLVGGNVCWANPFVIISHCIPSFGTHTFTVNTFKFHRWRGKYFKQFSFFVYNYLNILTTIFVVVLIPLRITDSDIQWVFASLAYVSYSLRVFKYFQAIPWVCMY